MKKTFKNEIGITLIALVITIIVLLILAGVSIAMLTGDNGILTQAQRAKEETEIATDEEQRKLAMAEAAMNFKETKYQGITIPAGMAPTRIEGESTIKEGLVAIDKNGNEWVWIEVPETAMSRESITFKDETGYSEEDEGNCGTLAKNLKTYVDPNEEDSEYGDKWYADAGTIGHHEIVTEDVATEDQKGFSNGCGLTLKEYKETYQKMIKSVYKNKGFWIGRYEAGIEESTGKDKVSLALGRTASNNGTPDKKAISQKDGIPYTWVCCSEAQKLASQMSPDESKTSSLLFGIQWDLVCKYLESKDGLTEDDINTNSSKWGNYQDTTIEINSKNAKQRIDTSNEWCTIKGEKSANIKIQLSAGASNKTKKLNIYDFAGNEYEWTLELANVSSPNWQSGVTRGGGFADMSNGDPASQRKEKVLNDANNGTSFRPALY